MEENEEMKEILSIFTKGSAEEMMDRIALAFIAQRLDYVEKDAKEVEGSCSYLMPPEKKILTPFLFRF